MTVRRHADNRQIHIAKHSLHIIIHTRIHYSIAPINTIQDSRIFLVLWYQYIFHALSRIFFFSLIRDCSSSSSQKKEDRSSNLNCMLISTVCLCVCVKCWGGRAKQTIGRALAILIQLPEPYLSLHCGGISPPTPATGEKKKGSSSLK